MKILEGLLYTEDHEWIKVEGNKAYVGVTDFAQDSLGDIVFVELPEVDTELSKKDTFGVVESVKAASDLYIPVSGKVLETNEEIVDDPSLVNKDAYENWMIAIEVSDSSELDELLTSEQYEKLCGEEA